MINGIGFRFPNAERGEDFCTAPSQIRFSQICFILSEMEMRLDVTRDHCSFVNLTPRKTELLFRNRISIAGTSPTAPRSLCLMSSCQLVSWRDGGDLPRNERGFSSSPLRFREGAIYEHCPPVPSRGLPELSYRRWTVWLGALPLPTD